MKNISYNCKRCHRPGTAQYDPEWVSEVSKWAPMLTCNPCADYLERLRRLKDVVYKLSIDANRSSDQKGISRVRDGLTLVTKKIAFVVSREYRVMNEWSIEFVDQIMERPDKSLLIVDTYEKMIGTRARAAHEERANQMAEEL